MTTFSGGDPLRDAFRNEIETIITAAGIAWSHVDTWNTDQNPDASAPGWITLEFPGGGEQQFITYRLLHDDVENQIPSVKAATVYTFRSLWDPADAALVAAEQDCCRFFTFTLTVGSDRVVLDVVGPADVQPVIDAFVGAVS